jgi:hypothetical protein
MNELETKLTHLFERAAEAHTAEPNVNAVYVSAVRNKGGEETVHACVEEISLESGRENASRNGQRKVLAVAAAVLVLVVAAWNAVPGRSDDATTLSSATSPVGVIPGLTKEGFVELSETDPPPNVSGSGSGVIFDHGYEIEGVAPVGTGRPDPESSSSAVSLPPGAVCVGTPHSYGCGPAFSTPDRPLLTGITEGTSDVRAWAWQGLPPRATVVRFTDHDGTIRWQRPINGFSMFQDTLSADVVCQCRLDAFDEAGRPLASVDVRTASYLND